MKHTQSASLVKDGKEKTRDSVSRVYNAESTGRASSSRGLDPAPPLSLGQFEILVKCLPNQQS